MAQSSWKEDLPEPQRSTEFDVETGDFSQLIVEQGWTGSHFHYFFHSGEERLIKSFVLGEGQRVATMCDVTLIKKDGVFSPRLRFWKKDKTKPKPSQVPPAQVPATSGAIVVKAAVDATDCHESFWKLIAFLESFRGIELPENDFRITTAEQVELAQALQGHDKESILRAVKTHLGHTISERDVQMLVDRRATLATFEQLLDDMAFFDAEKTRLGIARSEGVWQRFFEDNAWIFGYGLTFVSCEAIDRDKLEQTTTGASIFGGGGKRIDAAMRTRGYIQSLLFAEIKRHDTELLMTAPYRQPDVYQVSRELSGAVSQVQKTTHKAIKHLGDLHRQFRPTGDFEFEVSTILPRQVVVAGNLDQLTSNGDINREKLMSFELFRRSQKEVEILTFDELLARARFIVEHQEVDQQAP